MANENITSLLEQEVKAVRNIPATPGHEEAVSFIVKHVHDLGGKLTIGGMDKAEQTVLDIATIFSSTDISIFFLYPSEAQHRDPGIVCKNDVMLLTSSSGKTRELVELVDLTKGLVPDMKFVVITSNPDSSLAAEVSVCLLIGAPKGVCPLGPMPTTFMTVTTVTGDILAVGTMKRIHLTNKDCAKCHHGGYLGSKNRELSRNE